MPQTGPSRQTGKTGQAPHPHQPAPGGPLPPTPRFSSTQHYRPLAPPATVEDQDACALYASVRKDGKPAHDPIPKALDALGQMLHRAGNIDGEGDGCGMQIDVPRKIWSEEIRKDGHAPSLALDPKFAVAHIFIPRTTKVKDLQHDAREIMSAAGLRVLAEREGVVDSSALGATAREEEPVFWQVGGLIDGPRPCFELMIELEQKLDVHVASLSNDTVVYKLMGAPGALGRYFPDLMDERLETVAVLGHNRYSTNTWPTFKRVQPFGVIGHNGEINTIVQLREEARLLGVPIHADGSDSQDFNRVIETFVQRDGLSLIEAMELVLPPIVNEIKDLSPELSHFYMYLRQAFGPFTQGPVALISRVADECLFSTDALGLRPIWQVETVDDFIFSSEPGVAPVAETVSEPKPLAPGEKVALQINPDHGTRLRGHDEVQRLAYERWLKRVGSDTVPSYDTALLTGGPSEGPDIPGYAHAGPAEPVKVSDHVLGGFGWLREDMKLIQQMASNGAEPIGSLGYDGPLAALNSERQNLADYFKETVAVVTNPAIDREREIEHFSCRTVFGARPQPTEPIPDPGTIELSFPIVLGGHHRMAPLDADTLRKIARNHKSYLLEDLWEAFPGKRSAVLDIACLESENTKGAIERLKFEAIDLVRQGAELIVLSDRTVFDGDRRYIDPHLAIAAIDTALKNAKGTDAEETNLRRRTSLVVRSGALRNVHDVMIALGLGADGVCPYVMFEVACVDDYEADYNHLCGALRKGMEKVISTIGIHEVRGYARQFSAIGIKPEIAEILGVESYYGSEKGGLGFAELDDDGNERKLVLAQSEISKPAKTFRFYPKVWKAANAASYGRAGYDEYSAKVRELEAENPVSLRHVLDVESDREPIPAEQVDTTVGHHDYPIVIASMSFGSQSETAFRAYAEAAKRINILSINGEGGEPRDMIGMYPKHRGQQIASGRFGVTSDLINSSYLVEIKIGQGAKPGEGGHLPAKKVTEKVAAARNATTGTDLISPSNNHDLYSIEDLAGLVDELKTANPDARVAVKVPVVPNIGTIGVGIAKAGADIITLSGFEGGTGAARSHALRHVGLPSDIGTRAVHRALMEAGIRNRVEIWADGGYRHGWDIVKLHCLGANRVGFGTLAMVSLGCTICRGCQLDTCHVGIATQIETTQQAELHGLKKFTPQVYGDAVTACTTFFKAMGEEVRQITAQLGYERAQDLVGRSDLLIQSAAFDRLDLTEMIQPLEEFLDLEPIDLPVSESADARAEAGIIVSRPIEMPVKEASKTLAALVPDVCGGSLAGSGPMSYSYPRPTNAGDRVLGTELAGGISRERIFNDGPERTEETLVNVRFDDGSVAGGGLGAFNVHGVKIDVSGGAQDGVGKCMFGGSIAVLKGVNKFGKRVNGSVGKSFAYGAQRGRLFVQGSADSRFCIRLSGADVVIGGEPAEPVDDSKGCLADRANIKGFAFEYMTAGRAVVLGDPGPWACAGMTGGRIYMRHWPKMGLTQESLTRRLGKGAKAVIKEIDTEGVLDIQDLLESYADELRDNGQPEEADRMIALSADATTNFLMCVPQSEQADPSVSTE
ncbi:MAG: alpha-hydroxy-acid oxidizing protein [Actinobacteria bacterium]|nr:alpha-hydroxy-acid oxidizing protein [Actinomycetota bacterium]